MPPPWRIAWSGAIYQPLNPLPGSPFPKGTYRCGSCNLCDNIKKDILNQIFHCRSYANCILTCDVYRPECEWHVFYVSRAKRKLWERHKHVIRTQNPNCPTAHNFKTAGHVNLDTLKVSDIILKNMRGGESLLRQKTFRIFHLPCYSLC